MCLIFGYYAETMFLELENKEQYSKMIYYLADRIANDPVLAVSTQAAEALENIIGNEDLKPKIIEMLPDLLRIYIGQLGVMKPQYLSVIEEISFRFRDHLPPHADLVVEIVQGLAARMQLHLQSNPDIGEADTLTVKCWNIIRTISEIRGIVPEYIDKIEAILLPLFEYMQDPSMIHFDDDIIFLLNSLVRANRKLTQVEQIIFGTFKPFLQKYNGIMSMLFDTMTLYLVYGEEFFLGNQEALQTVHHHFRCL
jgi:hypothetical protein